jgi:hypothetical protein
MMKRFVVLFLLTGAVLFAPDRLFTQAFAQALGPETPHFYFSSTEMTGIGGRYTALADGPFSLLSNPALLQTNNADLTMSLGIAGGMDIHDGLVIPPPRADIKGPLTFATINKGVGCGFFDHVYLENGTLVADLIGTVAYALPVSSSVENRFDLGFAFNVLGRFSITNAFGPELSPDIYYDEYTDKYYDAYGNEKIMDSVTSGGIGASVNVGILYTHVSNFAIGVSCMDVYSVVTNSGGTDPLLQIAPNFSVGLFFEFLRLESFSMSLVADFEKILPLWNIAYDVPIIKKIKGGININIKDTVNISFGLAEGGPRLGAGVSFDGWKLHLALSSTENPYYPVNDIILDGIWTIEIGFKLVK